MGQEFALKRLEGELVDLLLCLEVRGYETALDLEALDFYISSRLVLVDVVIIDFRWQSFLLPES